MEIENFYLELLSLSCATIEKKYEYLGEGAGRIVFGIDDKYVIKIAKNKFGQIQNNNENRIYNEIGKAYKKYFSPVYQCRNQKLIMKRATPLLSIVKDESLDIDEVFSFKSNKDNGKSFYEDIEILSKDLDLLYGDLMAVSSWGLVKINKSKLVNKPNFVNKPVLIDYGCTNQLYYKNIIFLWSKSLKRHIKGS